MEENEAIVITGKFKKIVYKIFMNNKELKDFLKKKVIIKL